MDEHRSSPPDDQTGPQHVPVEAMLYCPVCSTRLDQHKCKLVCATCGYYMSCADYY